MKLLSAADVETRRMALGVTAERLCHEAGITERTYRYITAGHVRPQARTLIKLGRALDRLTGAVPPSTRRSTLIVEDAPPDMIAALYRSFVAVLAAEFGVTPQQVAAADPRANRNSDPQWRACRHAAQAAIYLVNTALGIRQRRLAAILGLTPAAICLALRAVEDRRDEPAFDATLARAVLLLTGRAE